MHITDTIEHSYTHCTFVRTCMYTILYENACHLGVRLIILYRIAGKFGEFGESSEIHQTKTTQIGTYN